MEHPVNNTEEQVNNKSSVSTKTAEEASGYIWKTFVGNKKREDFLKIAIFLLIAVNGLLAFFLYGQKNQRSVYVIDSGMPKLANLISNDSRVDEQVNFFIKLWTQLLVEIDASSYKESRSTLKTLSSQNLMQRVLTAESASSNLLMKEIIQSETTRLRVLDVIIDRIERRGSTIDVYYSEIIQIDLPNGSEKYITSHKAELVTTNYSFNGVGLMMVDLDNLWKLERKA